MDEKTLPEGIGVQNELQTIKELKNLSKRKKIFMGISFCIGKV